MKKYSFYDDFMDTFFFFRNSDFTPVKITILLGWLLALVAVIILS